MPPIPISSSWKKCSGEAPDTKERLQMITDSETIQKPYNSRIIDVYIRLIKNRYPQIDIHELLTSAGMEQYQVVDQGHWFTQDQVDRFYEKLVQVTGNRNIAREAGRYAAALQDANLMSKYFLAMVGPSVAYDLTGKASANFTRAEDFTTRKLSNHSVEIKVTPKEGINEKPFQCENRWGLMEAISMLFNKKPPVIKHTECIFKGGTSCTYIITWENSPSVILGNINRFLILFFVVANAVSFFFNPALTLQVFMPAALVAGFALNYFAKRNENKELSEHLREVHSSTDELIKQININYNNTLITHEIGQVVNQQTTIDEILESVILISEKRLEFDRGLILLADENLSKLEFRSGFGYIDDHISLLKNTSFNLSRADSRGVFVSSFREKQPYLINDIDEIKKDLSPRSLDFARKIGTKAFICSPIICDNESLGILTVDNINSRRPLVQSDMSLLMGIASVIGIAVKNALLLEAREKQFQSILKVLASSIDARDPLTAGHSEKVTQYVMAICRELGLSREYQEMIRIAALLHDYGKIGVPDKILKKNDKLTDGEYSIIKTHAEKTKTILDQISFEGIYSSIPDIAGSHHERVDGRGYPNGIIGEEIPLGARIIAVADFFEAITARRHYRNPMTYEDAVDTILKEKGDHLDSNIVDVFLTYLEETNGKS
jgi:HD-GYP domain-containing protein (c-di-GMP phosphodiesterase class II)